MEWFNRVDEAYRSEFRELFEVHFARFDAKLEQRAAELRAETALRVGQLDAKLEQRVAQLDAKIDLRVGELDAKLEQRLAEVTGELRAEIAAVRTDVANVRSSLMKWMFIFWAGNVVTTAGLVLGAVSLLGK